MIKKFFEFNEVEFKPIKSFILKSELNPKIWDNFRIDENVREDLIQIANDYIKHMDILVEIKDIVLTGSLANYNWSEYSDFDLHIIFDFNDVNEDIELVRKFTTMAEKLWKKEHDIHILGYEVELYAQDSKDDHISSGQFSLLNNDWIRKPSKSNFTPDEYLIKEKAGKIMDNINDIITDYNNNTPYDEISSKIKKVWKKVKDNRKSGLSKEGEFSTENLVFKLLRRNKYIEKLLDVKRKSYDKQFK